MKRFNNFRRMLLPVAALAATIGLTLGGCTKVDDTLGGNLIPDNQQMRAGYVQLPRADELNQKKYVETRLFQTDSIVSSNITYGYMGSMLNDTLGHRSAGFLRRWSTITRSIQDTSATCRSSTRRRSCSR